MNSATTETQSDTSADVSDLLRQILSEVEEQTSSVVIDPEIDASDPKESGNSNEEVIFEMVVDGFQYILKRCYLESLKPACKLSPREQEVVRLVARGHSNKAIAAILEISPWTVSTHLRRVFIKLDVSSRAEMVACALKQGLLADLH